MSSNLIYVLLKQSSVSDHLLHRYIKYINSCIQSNQNNPTKEHTEKHHILPKEMFPEYKSFNKFPWNCAELTIRQHMIAHYILWKLTNHSSQLSAFYLMSSGRGKFPNRQDTYLAKQAKVAKINHATSHCWYRDNNGKSIRARIDDPRVLSGELIHHQKGMGYYKLSDGSSDEIFWLSTDDERIKDSVMQPFNKGIQKSETGRQNIIDGNHKTGLMARDVRTMKSIGRVPLSDSRWETGEIVHASTGMGVYQNQNGECRQLSINDPLVISGQFKGNRYGQTAVFDSDGNILSVSINDPRIQTGELTYINQGHGIYRNLDGENRILKTDDALVASGKFYSIMKGKSIYVLPSGERKALYIDDPLVLSGEAVSMAKGRSLYRDKDGNVYNLPTDDPRVLSGELKGHTKGLAPYKDSDGNIHMVSKNDPRVISGELVHIKKGIKVNNRRQYTSEEKRAIREKTIATGRLAKLAIDNTPIGRIRLDDPRWKTKEILMINTKNPK